MEDITVNIPSVGTESIFKFKEPIANYLKTKYNLDTDTTKLKVISVISMKDMTRNDLRDPFTTIYDVAGLSELDYKYDLKNNVPIVSFSFRDNKGIEHFIRSPASYIASITVNLDIEYINKLIVIDLNRLPLEQDLTPHFAEISSLIFNLYGVMPDIKQVDIGAIEKVSSTEHNARQTVIANNVTIDKPLSVRYNEITTRYNNLLSILASNNITIT